MRPSRPAPALVAVLAATPALATQILWQTSSAGDDLHLVDVEARRVVERLVVGPQPHGIAAPRDGGVVYVSIEANGRPSGELLWIDPERRRILHRLAVGPEPHAIAATPDGRWVYVPCRDGRYWVVDAVRKRTVKHIPTGGRPHNVRISADGDRAYLSPMGPPHRATVVDIAAGHEVIGGIPFAESLRPSALSDEGERLYQQIDGLNGFEVADTATRRVIATVRHPEPLGWFLPMKRLGWVDSRGFHRCHGLAVRPGRAEIWSSCGPWVHVHGSQDRGFPHVDSLRFDDDGYWLTFSPDGRYLFVALSRSDEVAIVDAERRELLARTGVGRRPKRGLVLAAPEIGD
ncbi:MAG: cytochrome D1 domain-containing protein [Candidatus Binatia bacterium]